MPLRDPCADPTTAAAGPVCRVASWAWCVVAVVLVIGILVGCSRGPRLDTSGAERIISEKLAKAYDPVEIGATSCPDDAGLSKGSTFACTTKVGAQPLDVSVKVVGDDGDVEFVTKQAVIDIAKVESDLSAKLHAAYDEPGDVLEITVDCGEPAVRVLAPHATFRCRVTASAQEMVQEVTVEDAAGNLTYRAIDP